MKYFINYKDEFSSKILLALVIFLVVWTRTLSSADYLSVGSSQYSHVTPSLSVNHERSHNSVMQEKECCVARLCGYKIQGNFSCKVSKYVISNGPQRSLPKWLWFDEENKTLKGIPSPADEGINEILIIGLRQHQNDPVGYICGLLTVKIVVSSLKDFPTSPIINNRFSKPSISQGLICQFNEPIVLASLVVAGNFHEMDGKEKINVLGSLLQDYHISIYDVFVLSNSDDSLKGLLQSSHVLASGPGANRSASGLSTTITWHVKCGVIHLDDSLFEVMEKLSKQLTFINNVSYAPIGWHVVTGFKKHHVRRRRNVVGTTTPAFSTIPISQATVITTKIKVTRTTHVIQTKMFTWSRPLPTFSSPYTVNKTSLLFQSSTISSRFNNTTFASQYNSASSISPVVTSLSNTMSSSQIISPSEQKTTHISQYMSVSPTLILSPGTIFSLSHISSRQTSEISHSDRVNSTFPVMSPSRNKSAMFQISSSKQERSSNSIKTSSQIHRTSTVTRYDSLSSTTSQLPSSKRRTLVQSSLTRSEKQRSTNVIVPSNRSSTSPTVQTVINNASLSSTVFHYVSGITSPVISILLTTEHFSSNVSNVSSTKAMTTAIRPNNSTTSLLQSSFSNFIDTSSLSSSRVYSSVLHITTSGTINETKSAKVNQTTFESSTGHIRSILLTTTLATNISVTTPISYTISPSYTPITSSRSSVPTPSFLSYTTTLYEASVSTSERILGSSHTTGTLVLSSRSVTRQTSDMDKTAESTSPLFTSGIISKSLQSSDYVNSKITKTLTTNSTLYSSRVDASSNDTMPPSSNSAMSSQLTSGSAVRSKLTSISVMKPTSTEKTFHIVTSQSSSEYKSILSPIPSTAHFTTATENTPTEQMKSTYSSLIQTTPVSIYTSFQTKTIRSGSLITHIVPNPSVSSLFTSHISGVVSSYNTRSDVGHSSMLPSSTLTSTSDQSAFKSLTPSSFSRLRDSLYKSSSSNKISERSPLTVRTTTPSRIIISSYQTPPASYFATTIPSPCVTYTTATSTSTIHTLPSYKRTSPSSVVNTRSLHSLSSYKTSSLLSSVVTNTPSLHSLSSYKTSTLQLSVATNTPSLHSLSSHKTSTLLSSVATNTPSLHSLSSHKTSTLLSSVATNTPSLQSLSSYKTSTLLSSVTSTPFLHSLSSYRTRSPSSVVTNIPSSSYHALTSPLSFSTVSLSSDFLLSSHSSTSSSSVVTTTSLSDILSAETFRITRSLSTVATITPSYLLSSYTTEISTSNAVKTASSSIYVSYHTRKSPLSLVTTIPYSLPPFKTDTSLSSKTPSSHIASSTSPPSTFTTLSLLTYVTTITTPTITSSSIFQSFYHTPTSTSSIDTVIPQSEIKSSTITPSSHSLTSHTTAILPKSILTITSPDYLSYHTSTSPSSATITLSLFSYHTLASFVTVTSSLLPVSVTSSAFPPSYHTPTSPLSFVTVNPSAYLSSSYNAILSPFSSLTESLTTSLNNQPSSSTSTLSSASYKTFSLSFLSSSIVSSQPSISSDLSSGWSMSYTSAKLSSQTSWFARPSYTSRQSPQTTTVLTPTSMMMPVTTSSSELSPSSVSSQSSSVIPTVPSKGSPKVYNSFDLLHVTVGKVFSVQIPVDTFYDREDGNTRNLRLECLTEAHSSLSENSWLQFNATTQTLYGLILKSQTENISSEYFLTASDRDGNTVFDAFTVSIDKSSKPLAAMFSVKLTGISLGVFNRDINNILSVVQAIAGYYGDKDESMIHVLTLTEGSVIFTWSNTSLQTCDEDLINDMASKLITKQGNIQPDFYNALSQKFIPGNIFVNYTGPCVLHSTENPSVSELSSHDTSPWVKYVLPSLVLAVVIVVIAVAFLLFKRHSGVKILKEDKQIFKRRKPIILDGEQEMSTLSGKPIQIPEDSLIPIRLRRESSFGTPEYHDDISDVPILPAPAYQRLPPMYRDGSTNRYNTLPPPYKMPPSYSC